MKKYYIIFICLFSLLGCLKEEQNPNQELSDAQQALTEKDYIEAEKCFDRYLRHYPDGTKRWEAWNSLLDLTIDIKQDERLAIEILETMLVEFEENPKKSRIIILKLGEKYHELRKWEDSARVWVKILKDHGASSEEKALAYRRLSTAYLRRLEFEPAREALKYCLNLNVSDETKSLCLYELADALMIMEELPEAETTLEKLLGEKSVSEQTRVMATFMLADVAEQLGKNEKAQKLFHSILDLYPNKKVVEIRLQNNTPQKPPLPQQPSNKNKRQNNRAF
ncbi:tetratricopeptide repeat protein [Desulfovibrio litoralis]|uniref:Uncharacterized protein n=1 Tax=Desulfovibrio litoralis DSM 11393 TaxID=1121455 RepID=A0A1M7RXU3_9BACT|nr:tetratricopeptide repeat protein [Desulfovibrio litoralis]SHN50882.1 hypothetical protein SAMN02745728_00296 [Desulfovibrio litoralis DSM 11393]